MSEFCYEKIKNPEFFKENVWKAHSAHSFYANQRELMDVSSLLFCLNGVWKFSYAKNLDLAVKGFEAMDYDCHDWDMIRVPAHIQMEGYDAPQYANVQYPWDGREDIMPGEIPAKFNPVASYVKYFTVPEHMKGKEIHVRFDGVESGFVLWINGSYVGYSEDSFTASEFDITPYLADGENKMAVRVFKWTSSSWCEDQDFFRFSGIYRGVYLVAIPQMHLEDYFVKTLFEDHDYSKSTLAVSGFVRGEGTLLAELKKDGALVGSVAQEVNVSTCEKGVSGSPEKPVEGYQIAFQMEVDNPLLWSAESPELYTLEMTCKNKTGEIVEFVQQMVGFRQFKMENNRMLLNGKRVVFKGVNRHEFSSISGRSVSREELEKDLRTMKRNNINAIRTCHYPDDELIYELCDRYGFYLIAENNLETHGTWDAAVWRKVRDMDYVLPNDKKEWKEMMYDRIRSTFHRDKNHPAILIWSCGNEAFGGETIFEMSNLFRTLDDTRLVHYEGVVNDRRYNDTSDMESRMYPKVVDIEEYLKQGNVKPFICCEYTHAMGNSCGAMHKYTQLADRPDSGYQGGFIWDYIDQSIYKKDRYGKWFQAYGGDFADRPCDYNFSGNGIAYGGERNESPKMQEVKYNYQNIEITVGQDDFTVWNKHLFVNTDTYICKAVLLRDGEKVLEKNLGALSVAPEAKENFKLPFTMLDIPGEYVVTISFALSEDTWFAAAGHEIAFGQGVLGKIGRKAPECHAGIQVVRGSYNIGVKAGDAEILFSEFNGLASYRYAGKELIEEIPRPNFWRAPTDNDAGNNMVGKCGQWKLASLYATTKGAGALVGDRMVNPVVTRTERTIQITYYYQLQTTPNAQCMVTYEVNPDGSIKTTLSFDPSTIEKVQGIDGAKLLGNMPEFGMLFKFNADYDRLEWYGNGPAESYADRKMGAKLGRYTGKVAEQVAEYLVPQECGNKTDVRFAKVMDIKGRGILFSGDAMSFSALPYTPHEMENAKHAYELPQVHYTVVRVGLAQMGIGGDDSWGAPVHEEYQIKTDHKLEFSFTMKGI